MQEYNWNINDINNLANEQLKNLLLSEYFAITNLEDISINKELSIKEFKECYKKQKKILIKYSKEIAKICDLLPYTLTEGLIPEYVFPHQNFNEDILLEIINTFIKTLNDSQLKDLFNKLITKDILKIIY